MGNLSLNNLDLADSVIVLSNQNVLQLLLNELVVKYAHVSERVSHLSQNVSEQLLTETQEVASKCSQKILEISSGFSVYKHLNSFRSLFKINYCSLNRKCGPIPW